MKMRKLLAVAACLASVVSATFLYGGAQNEADASKAELEQQLTETLKTRAESAQTAYEAMVGAFNAETVTFDTLADAIKKLAEAEVAMATRPEEEIAALRSYVERTKQWEARIKELFDAGTRGGEAKEYYSAKRDRESAEILLLKARIRANTPPPRYR
jgi:hypothetical protein